MPAVLPKGLRQKLAALSARHFRQRWIRGCFKVAAIALVAAGLVMGLDAWLGLPPLARVPLVLIWYGCVAFAAVRWLIIPLKKPIQPEMLAAAVEAEYPRLDERLTTSVELAGRTEEAFGSPVLIDLLLRETESRARTIDFVRAASTRRLRGSIVALTVAVAITGVALLLWPEVVTGLSRRFFLPWDSRAAVEPFAIVVTTDGDVVAKGRSWNIRAELVPLRKSAPMPEQCTLVLTPDGGAPMRLRMHPRDGNYRHDFVVEPVTGDFRYSLEAGPVQTEQFGVVAVVPPELTSAQLTIQSPAYAVKALESRRFDSLSDFSALQFSRVNWMFRFDKPPVRAEMIWRGPRADGVGESERRIPIVPAVEGREGAVEQVMRSSGTYRILVEGDRSVTTETPMHSVRVVTDAPPEFRRVTGLGETLHEISPNDVLTLQLAVSDDIGVSSAEIEYRVNDGPIQKEALALTGIGSREAAGTTLFSLARKANVGDRVLCRLQITDNRLLPELNLKPQVSYFPANDQWCEWQMVSHAAPVREREATAQRDAIDRAIRDLVGQLDRDRKEMAEMALPNKQSKLAAGNEKQIGELQQHNQQTRNALNDLAGQAEMQGLPAIADAAKSISGREMQQAADFLKDAAAGDRDRNAALRQAEKSTGDARERLERLRANNQQLAQQRLDAAQLEQLADKQSQLAEQTTTATEPDQKEQLKKEQRELANDLDRLTQQNEAAKEALRAASVEEARRLSDQAKALAQAERELDQAIRETERSQNAAKLTDTAKKQADVADQLDRLTKKLKRALTAAQTNAPSGSDAALTAETLRRGDADEAREQQRRTADALDQLADRLQNALTSARDPREAARQLSRLQEETRRRTLDNSRPGMPDRDALIEEERALQQAIDQLPVPDDQTDARREQIDAAGKAKQAITALQNGHSNTAADLMQRTGDALERLSGSLPSASERQKTARAVLAKLRQAQNQLSKQAQTAATQADRRPTSEETAALAKQQAELAELLAKLDAPVATDRRDAARQAAGDALDDLMAKRWEDVPASQAELNRKLQQLDDGLQSRSSADDKARDLARRQRELANESRTASGDSAKMSALQAPQEQIAREVQDLNSAASLLQDEAAIATTRASQALRDQAGDAATPELLNEAAKKLDELANQLAGKESMAERAARLARQQQELAQATNLDDPAMRQRQNQIVQEAKGIRAGDKATEEKKQAIDALERLRRLATNSTDYRPASRSASDALKRLAGKLAPLSDTGPEASASEMAQQQRDLAAATAAIPKQNGPARADSLEQAARQQRKLREQTNGMPSGTSPQAVQQARLAMAQAEQALARQEADQAKQLQFKAAAALDEAARNSAKRELAKTPASQPGVPSTEQIQQTREIARQLRELEKEVKNTTSGVPPPANATQRQDAIAEQTEELATRLQQDISPPAANAARQAREAMGSASEQQSTDPAEARKSRQRAAEALDRAAEEAARKLDSEMRAGSPNPPPPGQTGQAILKARGKMQSAQQQLEKDKAESASKEMRGAAQSLQQAAKGMQGASDQKAQGNSQPGGDNPNGGDADGKRPPVFSDVAKELERHAGKKWGDLPGELRTRILQDVKAQYGDDYARIIRLYFESLADRK